MAAKAAVVALEVVVAPETETTVAVAMVLEAETPATVAAVAAVAVQEVGTAMEATILPWSFSSAHLELSPKAALAP